MAWPMLEPPFGARARRAASLHRLQLGSPGCSGLRRSLVRRMREDLACMPRPCTPAPQDCRAPGTVEESRLEASAWRANLVGRVITNGRTSPAATEISRLPKVYKQNQRRGKAPFEGSPCSGVMKIQN